MHRIRTGRLSAAWLLILVTGIGVQEAGAHGVEVLRSDERGLTVSVAFDRPRVERGIEGDYDGLSVEGCTWVGEVGQPQVPVRIVRVGIPFGADPEVRVVSVEPGGRLGAVRLVPVPAGRGVRDDDGIGRIELQVRPDGAIYGRSAPFPDGWAGDARTATLRFQRILEVPVYPVRWNPVSGEAEWASSVTFEVRWAVGPERKFTALAPEEPSWERVYARALANYEEARPWRRAPSLLSVWGKSRTEAYKLVVRETGLYRVDYEDLEGVGSAVPPDELLVYRRAYSEAGGVPYEEVTVPSWVEDTDGDGFFGESDRLYFWGLGFRDAFMVNDYEDRFTDENVYWIGWGEPADGRMETTSVWAGTVPETLGVFPEILWFEEDRHFWNDPFSEEIDWWYWTAKNSAGGTVEFEAYDASPDSMPRLIARFQGHADGTHTTVGTLVNGAAQILDLGEQSFSGRNDYLFDTAGLIPPAFLTDGTNFFQFSPEKGPAAKIPLGAFLDWLVLEYDRELRARDDYLRFNTGDLTRGFVGVAAFASPSIHLVEVTDPERPKWVDLEAEHTVEAEGGYELVFPESTDVRKAYVAFTPDGAMRLPTAPTRRIDEDPCWAREGDYLVIAPQEFVDACEPLVSYRRTGGYQVQVARVEELFDAFNGGVRDPIAIKRYLRWGFDRWTVKPQFVLLVGDGSDDHRGLDPDSGPDFVPSTNVMWRGEPVPADNWYADLDDDFMLDLYLGRLPAGSVSELSTLVEKGIAYEQFDPRDAWRGRVLVVSDDRCSGTAFGDYRCSATGEDLFEVACRYSLDQAGASTGAELDTLSLYMSEYTGYHAAEGWHVFCTDGDRVDVDCIREAVADTLTPMLFGMLNEGVLLFQFQGHGNRKVMAHEHIVVDGLTFDGRYRHDVAERLSNRTRPFILATFGCHFADFSETAENNLRQQESLVEKMLLVPGGGAIAGIGPVGYEEFRAARGYQRALAEAFFTAPPWVTAAGETTGTRWILGELSASMVVLANLGRTAYRWVLLGDPGLVIDALPPGITATADGVPVEDGDVISAQGGAEGVQIRATIGDEVAIDTASVQVSIEEEGERTRLTRGEDFTVTVDGAVSGGRVVRLEYPHPVRLANYDVVIEAEDRNGRVRTFTLRVRFSYEPYFDGVRVFDGDYVSPDAVSELIVGLPKAVAGEDLSLTILGPRGTWVPEVAREALAPDSTRWQLRFALDALPEGAYALHLVVEASELEVVTFWVEADFRVRNLTNYPNPFEEGTEFIFQLTAPATVELRIFTPAGRRLAEFVAKGDQGYNRIYWDGRDEDGDVVANGVYLYRVTARSGAEEAHSEVQRAVKIR